MAVLFLLAAPLAAQDQSLGPDGDSGTSTIFEDNCSTGCNTGQCWDDINEAYASSDDVMTRTVTNGATIIYDFPTPSANPSTSTDAQSLDIEVSRCDDDASCTERTGGSDPSFSLAIYCNGSPLTTPQVLFSGQAVTGIDQTHAGTTFTFDTTDCATDGSDLQVFVTYTRSGGSAANRNWACVDVIEWNVTHGAAGGDELMVIGAP